MVRRSIAVVDLELELLGRVLEGLALERLIQVDSKRRAIASGRSLVIQRMILDLVDPRPLGQDQKPI